MKKGERPSYLYIAKGDKDSERATRLLEYSKIHFKRIPINKNGYGKFMFHDLHTTEVPSLVTAKTVHIGLRNIESFVKKNSFSCRSCVEKPKKIQ
jgi:hypothetical protein